MKNDYKINYIVRYSEVDSLYRMRLDRIIDSFQDITGKHSGEMGVDGESLRKSSNAFWVITKLKLKIIDLPKFDEEIELETWPTVVDKIRFGRDYVINRNGEKIVMGTGEWCTLDCDSGAIRKTASVCYPADMPHREDRSGTGDFIKLKEEIEPQDFSHTYRCGIVDTDTNNHTNNVAYVRMMLNAFSPKEFAEIDIDEVQVVFLAQTFFGDEITVYKKKTNYGYYIEGRHNDKKVFNAIIIERQ